MSIKRLLLILLFSLIFLITRIPRLHNDVINPDGVNWHYRSQQFINGLKYGDLNKTYQHYHPGVTVMWITAPAIELYRQLPGNDKYDIYNFIGFDFVAKYVLVFSQLVLTLVILFFLSKIIEFDKAYFFTFLLSLEPFFVGNSRLYHLDILLTLFLFLSLCLYYLSIKNQKIYYYVFTGIALGLAFLTKTVSLILVAYILFFTLFYGLLNKKFKKSVVMALLLAFVFSLTVYVLFPALWVNGKYIAGNLLSEGIRVGVRKGHDVIVLGEEVTNGGILFYPLVILIKFSPLIIFGTLASSLFGLFHLRDTLRKISLSKLLSQNFNVLLIGFYVGYLLIMTVPSKKLDRYMIVEYPFFVFNTVLAISYWYEMSKVKIRTITISLIGLVIFIIWPLIRLFPFYFTYTSPLVGNSSVANRLIGQKPFGVGIHDLKQLILDKYGYYPRLAFIDIKPIESIYPNSLVEDIREVAVEEYDLAVLGPNEEFPDRVARSPFNLTKDTSMYINGLEYWRIYVKRPK